jgi:hypothetical protein
MYASTSFHDNNSDLGAFVLWRATDFALSGGSHFVVWGLVELGLIFQAQLDLQALFVKKDVIEDFQASEVLAQAMTPLGAPINLVGVTEPSGVLTTDFI